MMRDYVCKKCGYESHNGGLKFTVVGRVAHGLASRVDRLKAIGNGQVPAVVRAAWWLLLGGE